MVNYREVFGKSLWVHTNNPDGTKRLSQLEVSRYKSAEDRSQEVQAGKVSSAEMKRGDQVCDRQVVNFDEKGVPDNLIPLWIYSDWQRLFTFIQEFAAKEKLEIVKVQDFGLEFLARP